MVKMKLLMLALFFMFLNNASSCGGGSNVTGSTQSTEITHVSFSNLVRSVTNDSIIISGTIINNSESSTIYPPWEIECQFYDFDDNLSANKLLGGDNTTINNKLSPGTALDWDIELRISNPNDYENFTVSDLRALRN